jgi:hypothetical protein
MFDSASVSYAYRNANPTATSATTGTVSVWVKRSAITGVEQAILSGRYNDNNQGRFSFTTVDKFQVVCKDGGSIRSFVSDAVFRDCSGWYHFVIAVDGTQVTGSDRINVYCNGELLSGTYATALNMQFEGFLGSASVASIGRRQRNAEMYFNGYLAEIVGVDGQQLTATSFGQFKNGIWVPKKYTGTYGLAGCHVKFENSADLGNDSANVLDYTLVNIGTDHQVLDSPTNNYGTLDWNNGFHNATYPLHEGGLEHHNAAATWLHSQGTFLMKTGKWYFEYTNGSDSQHNDFGICAQGERGGDNQLTSGTTLFTGYAVGWGVISNSGVWVKWNNNSGTAVSPNTLAANDIIMVALDCDANKVWFGKNGTWFDSGNPATGANAAYSNVDCAKYDIVACQATHTNVTNKVNFGQRAFSYTPPSGFKSCCTGNLEEPTVLKSSNGFDVVLYEGTGAELAITDLNFTPDFVWIKNRDAADSHQLFDSVRGATKALEPDATAAENTDAQSLKTFDSSGFTLGTMAEVNTNAESYVAWCMKKGAKYGFDIQTYTGTGSAHTESHDLGGVPELIIAKNRTEGDDHWPVYHHHALNKTDPETDYGDYGLLSVINAWTDIACWNDTAPTSTVFSVGTNNFINENTKEFVAYLWRSIDGFSKVFSYEGNGNALGPYVYCGFRPRFVIIKDADSGSDGWIMFDTARDTYNPTSRVLYPYIPNVENTGSTHPVDVFSNGFKIKATTVDYNRNNSTMVGIAFAEQPEKFSNAR